MSSTVTLTSIEPTVREPAPTKKPSSTSPIELQRINSTPWVRTISPNDDESPLAAATFRQQEKWNNPRVNTFRWASILWAFIGFGMGDASYGALLPSIEAYYGLSYIVVSIVFLAPFAGYGAAAMFSDLLHTFGGQRFCAGFASSCRLAAYIVLSFHPPYPVVVVALIFCGLGNGLYDGSYNAWVGDLQHSNELLGIMHGFYGAGATISPAIATAMVVTYGLQWYQFYYIMVGVAAVEVFAAIWSFWGADAAYYQQYSAATGGAIAGEKGRLRAALKQRETWIIAFFLLAYTGAEVALGGWIVTFMIRQRNAAPFAAGMTSTGFWLGLTLGRFVLGFITPRLGETWAITGYLVAVVGLQLVFWLVPQFYVSAVAVGLLGFFLGPMFPSAVVALIKLLPKRLHVGAVGFASALGGGGAAVLPFAVGAIAQAKGVQVLQPIILALLASLLALWLILPKIPKHAHAD